MIPRSNFSITKGSPKHYVVVGGTGKNNDHFFCGGEPFSANNPFLSIFLRYLSIALSCANRQPDCGSSLYTMLDSLPDVTVVKSGGLDDPEIRRSLAVGIELYTKDRIGFVNELHGAQQEEAFGDLGK